MHRRSIPWYRVDLGEVAISGLAGALRDRRVTMGPLTRELERRLARFLEVPDVVAVNSGASAILAALMACDVGPGDDVIVPGLSFVATANAPRILGARVRLVDVCRERPVLDPDVIEAAITPRTRAIVPVHLNGRAADLDALYPVAEEHGLKVVEDAAQALGSRDDQAFLGTRSHVGCFSTGITKLVTTGEGGFLTARQPETLDALRRIRNNGASDLSENRFDTPGFNFRPLDLLASLGLTRLDRLEDDMESLRTVYRFYEGELRELPWLRVLPVDLDGGELPLWFEVACARRDLVLSHLGDRGIQARPFPPALCDSPHLEAGLELPRSRYHACHGLVLPSGPDQSREDLALVVEALREIGRGPLAGVGLEPCPT